MKTSKKTSKVTVGLLIVIMMTSIAAVAIPSSKAMVTNATGQSGVVSQADTNYPVKYGYPDLGPLTNGVTATYTYQADAFISISPNPVGVNQQVLINVWTSPGMYHAFYMQGYTVNIVKPDGTKETLGPVNSYMGDATFWWSYNVDQTGTWQFQFASPGTYLPATNYTDSPTGQAFQQAAGNQFKLGASVYYSPSTTNWMNLTVQQKMVAAWPSSALPGAGRYWERPINPMNRDWWTIAGNYPFNFAIPYSNGKTLYNGGRYNYIPYVQAPNSCHVVWMKQNALSGLIGGMAYQSSVFSNPGTPAIIYDGRCYQSITQSVDGASTTMIQCYDLQTGKVYWTQPAPTFTSSTGTKTAVTPQYIDYQLGTGLSVPGAEASNGYTVRLVYIGAYLVEWEPFTGAVTLNISLPTFMSSTFYSDPYVLSVQSGAGGNYFLINWTIAPSFGSGSLSQASANQFSSRIISNISWPLQGIVTTNGIISTVYDFDTGIAAAGGWNYGWATSTAWCIGYAFVTADLRTGAILAQGSSNDTGTFNVQNPVINIKNGLLAMSAQNGHWNCWDARTGRLVWTSQSTIDDFSASSPDYPWGNWWAYNTASYDLNETASELIQCSYAGIFAFNWANGDILWHYYDNNTVPFESPYGGNAFFTACEIADGKVYGYAGEHTPSQPINRGWDTICLNATNGALIWRIHNPMAVGAVSDGYLCAGNQDDGYMYVFGIGKTSTTLTTPDTAVMQGTQVVIKGTVLDQSPAQPGTPCVSKDSMSNQMEYLHMQQPLDGLWHNVTMTGVPVILTAIDQNNEVIDIGTTTSNAYDGTFGMSWTPPSAGTYHITATFAGDDSYGNSVAGDTLLVSAAVSGTPTVAPATTVPQNYATTGDLLTYISVAAIAIIIAIAIAVVLLMRKK